MKAYQKTQLHKLLRFLGRKKGESMLFLAGSKDETTMEQSRRERDFLAEARAFYGEEAIEVCAIDEIPALWDEARYDVILVRYVLFQRRSHPMDEKKTMGVLARHLTDTGRIFVLEHNRLGLATLAGDRYDGTGKDRGLLRSELVAAFAYGGLFSVVLYPFPTAENMGYIFTDARPPRGETLGMAIAEGTPRADFFDEGAAAEMAAAEGAFGAMANQFLCVGAKDRRILEQERLSGLRFRQYIDMRNERFRLMHSEYVMSGVKEGSSSGTVAAGSRPVVPPPGNSPEASAEGHGSAGGAWDPVVPPPGNSPKALAGGHGSAGGAWTSTEPGQPLRVVEPVGEAAIPFVQGMQANYLRLDSIYKGYTLRIAHCRYEKKRLVMGRAEGRRMTEWMDEALEREQMEEAVRLVQQMSDILSTPVRISVLDGKQERQPFSGEPRFVEYYGELSEEEEALLADELFLVLSPACLSFDSFYLEGRSWTLAEYEWMVDFAVPFSYLLYCGILGYCEGAAAKRFEERARIAGKDASLSVRALLLERMGIDSRRQAVFARMREHFEAYMTGSAVSPAIIKERCLEEGTLLPVGEVMEAFVDGNGTLPTEREEAFAKVGGGFFEKLMGVFRRTILKRAH